MKGYEIYGWDEESGWLSLLALITYYGGKKKMISSVFNCHYDVSVWERKWGVWK